MRVRDPKPEIQRLEVLVSEIRSGDIRLPKFQRPFVWSRTDMLELLDSIYNGYPIGSILLWHSSEQLRSERNIVGFDLARADVDLYPTNYLLDGQQRLTTLCGALYWEGSDQKSRWRIFFDLEAEEFKHARDPVPAHFFPLNRLLRTSDFIRQCMTFESAADPRRLYETAEKLLRSIKDYKIAVVKIGDITLDEVAPIFERINSTGRKLTMVDLMRAATWKEGFDLSDAIEEILDAVAGAGFGELSDSNVLRNISAAAGLGINKQDIDNLRKCSASELREAARQTQRSILEALSFFRERAGLDDLSYLPYGLQLAYAAEFFRLCRNPSTHQLNALSSWFWSTSVSRYFAGASTGQNASDLHSMRTFAQGFVSRPSGPEEIDATQFLFDQFNLRTASSTAFALFLKYCGGRSVRRTVYGREYDEGHVKEMERHLFEDLLPRDADGHNRNICQILNPFRGLQAVHQLDEATEVELEANLLDIACIESLRSRDYTAFLRQRSELVARELSKLTGGVLRYDVLFGDTDVA